MKRGQFTPFVILGLFIIMIIGVVLYYYRGQLLGQRETAIGEEIVLSEEAEEYYDAVQACAEWSTDIALVNVGVQGGYATVPEPYYDTGINRIPYYVYLGKVGNVPDEDAFLDAFVQEFNQSFTTCVSTITGFDEEFRTTGELEYSATLNEERLSLEVIAPFSLALEDDVYYFEEFKISRTFPGESIFSSVQLIIDAHEEDFNSVPFSLLLEHFAGSESTIELNRENDTVLYSIVYRNSSLNNLDYHFNFLIKYDWETT